MPLLALPKNCLISHVSLKALFFNDLNDQMNKKTLLHFHLCKSHFIQTIINCGSEILEELTSCGRRANQEEGQCPHHLRHHCHCPWSRSLKEMALFHPASPVTSLVPSPKAWWVSSSPHGQGLAPHARPSSLSLINWVWISISKGFLLWEFAFPHILNRSVQQPDR